MAFAAIAQYGFQVYCHPKHARLDLDIARNTCKQADAPLSYIEDCRLLLACCDIAQIGDDVAPAAEKRKSLEERPHRSRFVGEPGNPDDSERVLARVEGLPVTIEDQDDRVLIGLKAFGYLWRPGLTQSSSAISNILCGYAWTSTPEGPRSMPKASAWRFNSSRTGSA